VPGGLLRALDLQACAIGPHAADDRGQRDDDEERGEQSGQQADLGTVARPPKWVAVWAQLTPQPACAPHQPLLVPALASLFLTIVPAPLAAG
jgi:hypothetical protein